MCSNYDKEKEPICALLSEKDEETIDFIKRAKVNVLLWAVLGSGVAGKELLNVEKDSHRPWSKRGMSDSEFIDRVKKLGIEVFAVLWQSQGYRFEKDMGAGKGLGSEMIEESACRSLRGAKPKDIWLLPGFKGKFDIFYMCLNSEIWKAYLKEIIDFQMDSGVAGVQIDESSNPFDGIILGAGLCKNCLRGFEDREKLVEDAKKSGFFTFHIIQSRKKEIFKRYFEYLKGRSEENFRELAEYIKKKGGKVTGNFYSLLPNYWNLVKYVDFISFELGFIPYKKGCCSKNHCYYRLGRALDRKKDIVMVPDILTSMLLRDMRRETVIKILRVLIGEALANGGRFMVPYSCYTLLGKPFYPPIEPFEEYHKSAIENRKFFENMESLAEVAIKIDRDKVEMNRFLFPYSWFFKTAKKLADMHIPYDFVFDDDERYRYVLSEEKKWIDGIEKLSVGKMSDKLYVSHYDTKAGEAMFVVNYDVEKKHEYRVKVNVREEIKFDNDTCALRVLVLG